MGANSCGRGIVLRTRTALASTRRMYACPLPRANSRVCTHVRRYRTNRPLWMFGSALRAPGRELPPPALAGAIPCDRGDYSPTMDRYRLDAAHGCPTPRGISRVCTIATRHRTIRSPLEAKETSGAICPILLTSYTSQRGNPVTAAPVFKNVDPLRLEMAFSSTFLFAESALRAPGQESPPHPWRGDFVR